MTNFRSSVSLFSDVYMMTLFRNAENRSKQYPTSFFRFQYLMLQPFFERFIVRDFVYSEQEIAKQENEFEVANATEKELWVLWIIPELFLLLIRFQTELLRLARTNFSESFQILVHLKVIRLFVESVLRYGLPAEYIGIVVEVSSCYYIFMIRQD